MRSWNFFFNIISPGPKVNSGILAILDKYLLNTCGKVKSVYNCYDLNSSYYIKRKFEIRVSFFHVCAPLDKKYTGSKLVYYLQDL